MRSDRYSCISNKVPCLTSGFTVCLDRMQLRFVKRPVPASSCAPQPSSFPFPLCNPLPRETSQYHFNHLAPPSPFPAYQVRVLGGSLTKCLQMAGKRESPASPPGLLCINCATTRLPLYPKASSIAPLMPPS